MITRFCLVRHGETDWNVQKRLQGHIDIGLNAHGEAQARATARLLSSHEFAAVFCSDLKRAQTTASIIAPKADRIVSLPGLRERHYGLFQGLTYREAQPLHPEVYARHETREPDFAFPDNGESLRDVHRRVLTTLSEIVDRHVGQTILVVTHGGVLDIVHRISTGKPLEAKRDFVIPNTALNWISHDSQVGWQLDSWAEISHLTDSRDELA